MKVIEGKIVCIQVGNKNDSLKMNIHVNDKVEELKKNGIDIGVLIVWELFNNYLDGLRNHQKAFGILIGGHDDKNGFQIYRSFLDDKIVVKEREVKEFAILGSGSGYANDILIHRYDFNMSEDNAYKLAIQAVLNASIYDKNGGGSIHTYQVTNECVYPFEPCRALRGYLDYFNHYNPAVMLFLVYEANARTHLLGTTAGKAPTSVTKPARPSIRITFTRHNQNRSDNTPAKEHTHQSHIESRRVVQPPTTNIYRSTQH